MHPVVFNLEMARTQEAVTEARKAVELEPLSPFHNSNLALSITANAITTMPSRSEQDARDRPKLPSGYMTLGGVYAQLGNYKQAIEQWIKAIQLSGGEERAKRK